MSKAPDSILDRQAMRALRQRVGMIFKSFNLFLHQGKVHEQGTPEALFGQPHTQELRQFLSSLH